MIISCDCNTGPQSSGFQDKEYGKSRRVATVSKAGKARCTCCGKEKNVDSPPTKK